MKIYENGDALQQKILKGATILANNVGATLGPKGRNVIIHPSLKNINFARSKPIVTKDGVTVAKFVDLEDPFENLGAQMIREAASKTNSEAGDGTTTATILAHAIVKEAQRFLNANISPVEMRKGMEKAVDFVVDLVLQNARPISSADDIEAIATISANNDEVIGRLISQAVILAGKDGLISIKDGKGLETILKTKEGFPLNSPFAASVFINEARFNRCGFDDPIICVTDERFERMEQLLPILKPAAEMGRPLVLVCEEIDGEALAVLIENSLQNNMRLCAVKAPRYGDRFEILKDLAVAVGATFYSRNEGRDLRQFDMLDFGTCKRTEINAVNSIFMEGEGDKDKIEGRIAQIQQQMEMIDDLDACAELQERISRLNSAVVIVEVGAPTEIDAKEKKYRIEDALEAVRSAREDGVSPGGGTALVKAAQALSALVLDDPDQQYGVEVIRKAIAMPLRRIVQNAGGRDQVVINTVEQEGAWAYGYDAKYDRYGDMFDLGIIDPAKVTKCALINALSVASMLLTSNHAIVEK
jgi:chaperonin GroEL